MPTPTISRSPSGSSSRFRRQQAAPTPRFGAMPGRRTAQPGHKPARGAGHGRRASAAPNRFAIPGRKPQKSSGISKAISSLTSAMPGMGSQKKRRGKSASTGKRAGGLALLAGGIGMAMKNRGKIMGMMQRGEHDSSQGSTPSTPATGAGTTPATMPGTTMPGGSMPGATPTPPNTTP